MLGTPCLHKVKDCLNELIHEEIGSWTPPRTRSKITGHLQLLASLLETVQKIIPTSKNLRWSRIEFWGILIIKASFWYSNWVSLKVVSPKREQVWIEEITLTWWYRTTSIIVDHIKLQWIPSLDWLNNSHTIKQRPRLGRPQGTNIAWCRFSIICPEAHACIAALKQQQLKMSALHHVL